MALEAADVPMRLGRAAFEILQRALESGFANDDNAGSMMRVCEADGGARLQAPAAS